MNSTVFQIFLTMWFSYNARCYKLSDTAIYVRLRFCAPDSVGFIQPVWFMVRYNNVQRNDVPVRLPDTYECVLDEAVTEFMLLMLILLVVTRTTEIGAMRKDAKNQIRIKNC